MTSKHPPLHPLPQNLDGAALRIGIVMSRFNPEIGQALLQATLAELERLSVAVDCIDLVSVPGALEIPLSLLSMAQGGQFDALIALGAVIRGETYHFELVANEAARGIMQTQLEFVIPIANGVLTTENEAQALARVEEKGRDCARAAVEMANLLPAIEMLES